MSNENSDTDFSSNAETTASKGRAVNELQAFEHNPELHANQVGGATRQILMEWVKLLPDLDVPVLDIAAGMAIEASFLAAQGVTTIAQDPSDEYLKKSFHSAFHRKGIAEALPDESNSLRGILCKDALIFMSPQQRIKAFREAHRVLVSGGLFLLITEYSTTDRALYIPHTSKYPQTLSSVDFKNSYLRFVKEIERMRPDNDFFSIQYRSEPKSITRLAGSVGFECVKNELHDYTSGLAQENRWVPRATLVMIFKKK